MELLISAHSDQNGASNSTRCKLESAITLGRGPESLLQLDSNGISREHLKLHAEGDALFITDLSSNGTWLNTQRLPRLKPHRVRTGDDVQIPGFKIRIEWPEDPVVKSNEKASETARPPETVKRFKIALSKIEITVAVLALASLGLVLFVYASS